MYEMSSMCEMSSMSDISKKSKSKEWTSTKGGAVPYFKGEKSEKNWLTNLGEAL